MGVLTSEIARVMLIANPDYARVRVSSDLLPLHVAAANNFVCRRRETLIR